jgi:hypothetical protein
LIDVGAEVLPLADLELQDKDSGAYDYDGVYAATEARDYVLEKEMAGKVGEGGLQQWDLREPRITLSELYRELTGLGEAPDYRCRR